MPIRYKDLGPNRRLNEIVFAGSHDASITSGSAHAKTQSRDIAGQADAGVRLFDLRILARSEGNHQTRLVGYHGSAKWKSKKDGTSAVTGNQHTDIKTAKYILGEFGLGLRDMLQQARAFVESTGEFLIFKFDKCTNYPLIAEFCVETLGGSIYTPIGKEFSKLTLTDLTGKVACVFKADVLGEMGQYGEADGILGFKSLKSDDGVGTYDPAFSGLQYFGKGGTNPLKIYQTNKMKRADNEGIQRGMLETMAAQEDDFAANVLGMMYWTSTGSLSSIHERNEHTMWGASGVRRMGELWRQGLEASVATQLGRDHVRTMKHGGVKRLKAYFPNIVMIDFADSDKCQTIYDLNTAADQRLVAAYRSWKDARA